MKRVSPDVSQRTRVVALLLSCALPFAASRALAESTDGITIGTSRVVESRVLKEHRTVYIYLPESYRQSRGYRRYPVLYVRDGGKFFHSFTGAVQHLASDATPHVPEMIVVAIVETDRVRDSSATRSLQGFTGKVDEGFASSGGGENFRRFLEQELVPYIDKEFSTSSYRIYCGYSFTGLSVIASGQGRALPVARVRAGDRRGGDLRCSGSAGADTGEVSAGSSAFGCGREAAMVTFAAHCE